MNIKPIVKEAIRRVRESGDWLLLDCLELIDRRNAGEDSACAVMRWCGHSIIGYASDDVGEGEGDCPFCDGDGECEVEGANGRSRYVSCPECWGDGVLKLEKGGSIPSEAERLTWRDLNGEPVSLDAPASGIMPRFFAMHEAADIVAKAKADLEKKAVAA